MQISHLEVFVTVAQTGSMSKAARILFLSQPAVSSQIHSLEQRFGVTLFERSCQGVTLTLNGEVVYRYIREALDLLGMLEIELAPLKTEKKQHQLAIAASSCLGNLTLPGMLWAFKERYPHVQVRLETANTRDIMTRLANGVVDIALMEIVESEEDKTVLEIPGFVTSDLIREQLGLLVPNTSPWNLLHEVALRELTCFPFILREDGSASRLALENALAKTGLTLQNLNIVAEIDNLNALSSAIVSGVGCALGCRQAAKLAKGMDILFLALPELDLAVRYCLVYRKKRIKDIFFKRFIDFLFQEITGSSLDQPF